MHRGCDSGSRPRKRLDLMKAVAVEEHDVADVIQDALTWLREFGCGRMIVARVSDVPYPKASGSFGSLQRDNDRERRTARIAMLGREALGVEVTNAASLGNGSLARKHVHARTAPPSSLRDRAFGDDAHGEIRHRRLKARRVSLDARVGACDVTKVVAALAFFEVRVKCTTERILFAPERARPVGATALDAVDPRRALGLREVPLDDDGARGGERRVGPLDAIEVGDERTQWRAFA